MSKKSKRQIRKEPSGDSVVDFSQPVARAPSNRGPAFNPDYTYIIRDLRRIGILAASFVAILIVLALVLPK